MRTQVLAGAILLGLHAAGSAQTAGQMQTLNVALATVTADSLNLVAKAEGIFAKHGLNVVFTQTTPATLASAVASGQSDIGIHAMGVPLSVANSGKKTSVIMATTGGGQGGSVFGSVGLASLESLKSKSDCKIGTLTAGSSAAGFAVLYKKTLGLPCEITPFQDLPSQIGALVAKRVDVLVGAYPNFIRTVGEGKATLLVDSRDPAQAAKYLGEPFPEVGAFGLSENLPKKRALIVAYIKSLMEAQKLIEQTPAQKVAASMKKLPELAERSESLVEEDVKALQAYRFRGTDQGRIIEAQWKRTLDGISLWGLPNFSVSNPTFSYDAAVDMSYYDAAMKN